MDFNKYILENALILIPALYVLGMIIKNLQAIDDKYIPSILLLLGIGGAISIMGFNVDAIIQGILVTGATVFTNQIIKQNLDK